MIELPWAEFKNQVLGGVQWSILYFELANHYFIYAKQNQFTVVCKMHKDSGADQLDFENNYKNSIGNIVTDNARTQFEREDIRLQIAKAKAIINQNGEAVIRIRVPGIVGQDSRYIAGGYAFTDVFTFGDAVTEINVVDVDNIAGYGAETVLGTYHDVDADSENSGWYFWPSPQVGGEIEVEQNLMGYYGNIKSGFFVEMKFKMAQGSTATTVYCNLFLGKVA
jgi:hypothetical protein